LPKSTITRHGKPLAPVVSIATADIVGKALEKKRVSLVSRRMKR
jgi:hypothetical protein